MSEYKSGETVPQSGIWMQRSSESIDVREEALNKDTPFPPTDEPGGYFVLVRATNADPASEATGDAEAP